MVVTATLALAIVIWCVYRMHRYPLAKGLRRLAPVYVPSVLASRPIIRLANRMLLAMPRPEATRLVDEEEGVIDLGDHILNYVIYRPKNASGPLPAMLYMHGGGFFLEAAPYLYGKAMGYSSGAGCIVMVPRYRTSDVHPWTEWMQRVLRSAATAQGPASPRPWLVVVERRVSACASSCLSILCWTTA